MTVEYKYRPTLHNYWTQMHRYVARCPGSIFILHTSKHTCIELNTNLYFLISAFQRNESFFMKVKNYITLHLKMKVTMQSVI